MTVIVLDGWMYGRKMAYKERPCQKTNSWNFKGHYQHADPEYNIITINMLAREWGVSCL